MSDIAIRVEGLGKQYRIGMAKARYKRFSETMMAAIKAPIHHLTQTRKHLVPPEGMIWALHDVSFEIKRGEAVGIIGHNGAGKSTLLKILSRITEPTEGRVEIHGRLGSLLEVGTGFHPELTGRENIYLNGAILGMKKPEINHKFDEIVDFSGVAKFLDTPVKRYSSGMYVRLAFAVAAHLEPEILLVDEVLAVGDADFQKKCLGKMGDVVSQGRTVLFVSHNMAAITKLTNMGLLFEHGSLIKADHTLAVVSQYFQSDGIGQGEAIQPDLEFFRRGSNAEAAGTITKIKINDLEVFLPNIPIGQEVNVHFYVHMKRAVASSAFSLTIKSNLGEIIATLVSADAGFEPDLPKGTVHFCCNLPDLRLMPGKYMISVGINPQVGARAWDAIEDYPGFVVTENDSARLLHRPNRLGQLFVYDAKWQVVDDNAAH